MPVQRFLPDVDRTRRGAGWVFTAIGLCLGAGLAVLCVSTGRFGGSAPVLLVASVALFGLGLYLRRPREVFFEIDLDGRKYAVIQNGVPIGSGQLDSLGPLTVTRRMSAVSKQTRSVIEYVVTAARHSNIDLYAMDTPGKARQKMAGLARAWRVSCQSYGGAVRGPDELDVPLHQRLKGDLEARTVTPLRPEWGVRIEALSPGYALVSTPRSATPLRIGAPLLLLGLFGFVMLSPLRLLFLAPESVDDPVGRVLMGLLCLILLTLLWMLRGWVRDTFFPGTVLVTEGGVSYRGSRMAFDRIEEVTATVPIEVVGNRRMLRLAGSFCPPAAASAVAHELQRLILEVASGLPVNDYGCTQE